MKGVSSKLDLLHLRVGDFDASGIGCLIESGSDFQSRAGFYRRCRTGSICRNGPVSVRAGKPASHQPQTLKWLARKATRSQRQACAATPGSSLMTRAPARHTTRRSCTLEICTTYSASLPESPRSCLTQNIGSAPEKAEADAVSEDLERGNRVVRRRPGPRSRALSH